MDLNYVKHSGEPRNVVSQYVSGFWSTIIIQLWFNYAIADPALATQYWVATYSESFASTTIPPGNSIKNIKIEHWRNLEWAGICNRSRSRFLIFFNTKPYFISKMYWKFLWIGKAWNKWYKAPQSIIDNPNNWRRYEKGFEWNPL